MLVFFNGRLFVVCQGCRCLDGAYGGKAYLDDDDEEEITDSAETFNQEWIEVQHESSFDTTRALINYSGQHIVMYGLFCQCSLGPKLYSGFDIPPSTISALSVEGAFREDP